MWRQGRRNNQGGSRGRAIVVVVVVAVADGPEGAEVAEGPEGAGREGAIAVEVGGESGI